MTEETISLPVVRYRDKAGEPTCATDVTTGKVCKFYATARFGQHETCWFGNQTSRFWEPLRRRDGGSGTLIPIASCPVWAEPAS